MKITRSHYEFWCYHKAKVSWYPSQEMLKKGDIHPGLARQEVSIHQLIPLDNKFDKDFVVHSTISILKRHRNRPAQPEDLENMLYQMATQPGTMINPRKRSAICLKWLFRIMSKKAKDHTQTPERLSSITTVLHILNELKKMNAQKPVRDAE